MNILWSSFAFARGNEIPTWHNINKIEQDHGAINELESATSSLHNKTPLSLSLPLYNCKDVIRSVAHKTLKHQNLYNPRWILTKPAITSKNPPLKGEAKLGGYHQSQGRFGTEFVRHVPLRDRSRKDPPSATAELTATTPVRPPSEFRILTNTQRELRSDFVLDFLFWLPLNNK